MGQTPERMREIQRLAVEANRKRYLADPAAFSRKKIKSRAKKPKPPLKPKPFPPTAAIAAPAPAPAPRRTSPPNPQTSAIEVLDAILGGA